MYLSLWPCFKTGMWGLIRSHSWMKCSSTNGDQKFDFADIEMEKQHLLNSNISGGSNYE